MPSLRDAAEWVVKRISALTRTATAADLTDNEYMAVDNASAYTRKITVASLATWILGKIKSLATSITAFRTGDVIPVDGPSGTAKMSKDDLLKEAAQKALTGNAAQAFDPERTSENCYRVGEKVVFEGEVYFFRKPHYGPWVSGDVSPIAWLLDNDEDIKCTVKGLNLVGVIENSYVDADGNQYPYNGYNTKIYLLGSDVDYIRVTARIGAVTYIGFYDVDNVLISSIRGRNVVGTEPNFIDDCFFVPGNAAILRVSYGALSIYKCVSNLGVQDSIADIYNQCIEENVAEPPKFSHDNVGYYIDNQGALHRDENYSIRTYYVANIQSFILTAKVGIASCILFRDKTGSIVGYVEGKTTLSLTEPNFVREKIEVPLGAAIAEIGYGNTVVFSVENALFIERVKDALGVNKLKGKKVAFIGDSITAGAGSSSGGNYVNQVSVITGCTSVNLGVNGTCIANNTKNGLGSSRFVTRATSANLSDVDLVVVFGGTNDLSYDSKAIGDHFAETTITASGNIGTKQLGPITDTDTFAGALHDLVTTIQGVVAQGTPILFVTPLHRNNNVATNPNSYQCNSNGDFMIDFVNAIKDICGFYAVPVLDLYADGEINPLVTNYSYLFSDGLHPNNKGHRVIAERIVDFVENNISFIS